MITTFQSGGSGDPYMESVTIAFGKSKFTYKAQDQKGEPLAAKRCRARLPDDQLTISRLF